MNLVRLLLTICLFTVETSVLANTTNINEVTDLFERSVPNKDQYISDLEGIRTGGISSIEKGESLQHVQDIEKSESEASRLSSIRAVDLDEEGRKARQSEDYSFYDEGEFEPDLTKPGNKQHKEDVLHIVNATAKLLADLTGKLKELGINCKTVKGPKQKEPIYTIDVRREAQNNTIYDQFFCEEPRSQYRCTDSVTLTCQRKGKGYGDWEDRVIRFNGHAIYAEKMNWGYAIKWKDSRWGWHISPYHPQRGIFGWPDQVDSSWRDNPAAIIADARSYIAAKLQVSVEQIGENVIFPSDNGGRGVEGGNITATGQRHRVVWDEYEFKYQFREAFDICEEWAEDWSEKCTLQ
ncbi:MAG: hypothetical protein NWS20_04720 [Rickettsiaceae bacterium]|nr:hypothetical protein [Rickettsiaceae bacterium]MDP5020537.1 hypothetical protein [Rickettsiaceae bacterium]MDP5083110.1 hypothetical protein [Rickettsiaceae bacterium]